MTDSLILNLILLGVGEQSQQGAGVLAYADAACGGDSCDGGVTGIHWLFCYNSTFTSVLSLLLVLPVSSVFVSLSVV